MTDRFPTLGIDPGKPRQMLEVGRYDRHPIVHLTQIRRHPGEDCIAIESIVASGRLVGLTNQGPEAGGEIESLGADFQEREILAEHVQSLQFR